MLFVKSWHQTPFELVKMWIWEFMYKIIRVFSMLDLPYLESGVRLLQTGFLACLIRMSVSN